MGGLPQGLCTTPTLHPLLGSGEKVLRLRAFYMLAGALVRVQLLEAPRWTTAVDVTVSAEFNLVLGFTV